MTERIKLDFRRINILQEILTAIKMLMKGANIAIVMVDDNGHIGMVKNTELTAQKLQEVVVELTAKPSPLQMDSEGRLKSMVVDTSKLKEPK